MNTLKLLSIELHGARIGSFNFGLVSMFRNPGKFVSGSINATNIKAEKYLKRLLIAPTHSMEVIRNVLSVHLLVCSSVLLSVNSFLENPCLRLFRFFLMSLEIYVSSKQMEISFFRKIVFAHICANRGQK